MIARSQAIKVLEFATAIGNFIKYVLGVSVLSNCIGWYSYVYTPNFSKRESYALHKSTVWSQDPQRVLVVAAFSVSSPIRSVWGIILCVGVFHEVPFRWIPWHLFTMAVEGQRVVMWILTNQQAAW